MPAITGIEYKVSQFCTQSEVFSESCQSKPNLNCNYIFPIDWALNGIPFGAKSIAKDSENIYLCGYKLLFIITIIITYYYIIII